jgi:hypothetical protein
MKNSRIFAIPQLLTPIVMPALVVAASVSVFLRQAVAQNPQDRDQASARQLVKPLESPAESVSNLDWGWQWHRKLSHRPAQEQEHVAYSSSEHTFNTELL